MGDEVSHGKGTHYGFFPSDWLSGTRGLTPAETGVYITLVAMMYEREEPLQFDRARLARMCNCPAGTFAKILDVLISERKIIETPDGIWNNRVGAEIEATRLAMSAASDRGRKAAGARWADPTPQSDHRENNAVTSRSDEQQSVDHTLKKYNKISKREMHEHCPSNATQTQTQNIDDDDDDAGASARSFQPPPDPPIDPPPVATRPPIPTSQQPPGDPTLRERILTACGADPVSGLTGPNGAMLGTRIDMMAVQRWRDDLGLSPPEILAVVADVMAKKRDGPPSRLTYFDRPMQAEAGRKSQPKLEPINVQPANPHRTETLSSRPQQVAGIAGAAMRRALARTQG